MNFLDLPDDVVRQIVANLSTPDLFKFLSSHRRWHEGLGKSFAFWSFLLGAGVESGSENPRKQYMIKSYAKYLPAVKWNTVQHRRRGSGAFHPISAREGHLACVFSTPEEDRICITGGFTEDDTVYLFRSKLDGSEWVCHSLEPHGSRSFVYGSSLTVLDGHRAVRFGGFQAGGYSGETNQVAVLTMEEHPSGNDPFTFTWETIATVNPQFSSPRAYHTSTLLGGRYLVVVGGMASNGSILDEAILDTHTWRWLDPSQIASSGIALAGGDQKPSGRHGHSMVLDDKRDRFVLFGGGSGSDLLRSGVDNAEIWELKMGSSWEADILSSFPWQWAKIHEDPCETAGEMDESSDEDSDQEVSQRQTSLSPAECLCMGRCHSGIKVSPDSVLLAFGSGSPSTNGVLGYDLKSDAFVRTLALGNLPQPRFTFASAYLERRGYVLYHAGYCGQTGDALDDLIILDLAPYLKHREFNGMPLSRTPPAHQQVSDEEARRGRVNRVRSVQEMMEELRDMDFAERQEYAQRIMGQMLATGQFNGHTFMLLRAIASGAVDFVDSDGDSGNESENDDEYTSDDAMGGL